MAVVAEPPSGTVTFMFTDIEGSTRLWEERPEEMREIVAQHDACFRAVIEANDGYVVKGTGDGFHAAFARAADAVRAACRLQAATADLSSLEVRIGINTGEVQERDGDYFGPPVNRAARLMGAAYGGQILVSSATERLLTGVDLRDLGSYRLRDLSPEHVYQVCVPGLKVDFPPIKSLDSLPGNLPVQLTSFLGRVEDLKALQDLLGSHRLVSLTGVGGVGKTRLAVQAAAEALEHFPDGAWFCELAVVDDGDSMAQVVAAALGCIQRPGLSLMNSIVEYLKVRHLLLILDNCEHLLDEAGSLAEAVLVGCPKVTVLVTSREALDVTGERVMRVRSLDAPTPAATEGEVMQTASVRLFTDRAADAGANVSWSPSQLAAVAEICRRVDGIPLAIELAAARVSSMTPTDLATHLDERFRILTGRRRGRLERHQTLRATVEWSYQLLDERTREVFDRLGVFAGTFNADAACAVACDSTIDRWQVLDALSDLVAKSMLSAEDGSDGSSRYSMLETLRQFARERLEESGDADRWRRKHAEYYEMFAREVGLGLTGPDEFTWIRRLQTDIENVRAAVGWALDHDNADDRELGVGIAAALATSGQSRLGVGIVEVATQAAEAARSFSPELRVPVLACAAWYWWNLGDSEKAERLAVAATKEGTVASATHPWTAHYALMAIHASMGRIEAAIEVGNTVRPMLETHDRPYAECNVLSTLAIWEAMAGQLVESRADAARSLELARRLLNPWCLAGALHATAWAHQRDDPSTALAAAEECIEIGRDSPTHLESVESVLALAGGIRSRLGNLTGAIELLRESIIVARDLGARPQFCAALDWSLSPLIKSGRAEVAAVFLGALTKGSLARVTDFPGVETARANILERVRSIIGDERADWAIAQGASLQYDDAVDYALRQLKTGEDASDGREFAKP
jgi:predicted ATPase/class 3 adenylate cyclase